MLSDAVTGPRQYPTVLLLLIYYTTVTQWVQCLFHKKSKESKETVDPVSTIADLKT